MWNASQKKTFAKQVIEQEFRRGAACAYLTGKMREALVAAHCFSIARGQMSTSVEVEAMDDLLAGVRFEVEAKLGKGFFE